MDKRYRRKKLYIRSDTKVKVKDGYLQLTRDGREYIVAFRYIYSIFISRHNPIPLPDLFTLAQNFRVYIVDKNGYLQGKVIRFEKG